MDVKPEERDGEWWAIANQVHHMGNERAAEYFLNIADRMEAGEIEGKQEKDMHKFMFFRQRKEKALERAILAESHKCEFCKDG